ncbi:MAG: hypothetical protein ABUT20_59715 [Bacteroidota bacterium]
MRKRIYIAVAVVVLLLLSFFGFLEYRQHSSYKIPIHANVRSIIKLNMDAFIKTFIKEYGFNFSNRIRRTGKEESEESVNTGIYLPGNIFIYTLYGKFPSTFFCTLPLRNTDDFKKFAGKQLGVIFHDNNHQSLGTAYSDKLTVLCSQEYAAIAYSDSKEEVLSVLKDLVDKNNLAPASNELIKQLKKDRSHIVYAFKRGIANAEFDGHKIELHADLTIPGNILVPEHTTKRKRNNDSDASFFLNLKPDTSLFKKKYSIKNRVVETDSILLYFSGYTDMYVSGMINQTDTITTYVYDDNFEKKEKSVVTTVKVPAIEIAIQTNNQLLNYLEKQKIVTDTHKIDREIFPLYEVSVSQPGKIVYLYTSSQSEWEDKFDNTSNFMEMNIDFQKLQPSLDSAFSKRYITGIKALHFEGRKTGKSKIRIDGNIQFYSSALRTLINIIKSL